MEIYKVSWEKDNVYMASFSIQFATFINIFSLICFSPFGSAWETLILFFPKFLKKGCCLIDFDKVRKIYSEEFGAWRCLTVSLMGEAGRKVRLTLAIKCLFIYYANSSIFGLWIIMNAYDVQLSIFKWRLRQT